MNIRKQIYYKGNDKEVNLWFKGLFDGMEIKEDRKEYPDSFFFFKGNELYAEQNEKIDTFWYSQQKIYEVLIFKFRFKYQKIKDLLKGMVEQHFKIRVGTPIALLDEVGEVVEQHFKIRVGTPIPGFQANMVRVEDHFKNKQ